MTEGNNTYYHSLRFFPVSNEIHFVPHYHYLLHVNRNMHMAQRLYRLYFESVSGREGVVVDIARRKLQKDSNIQRKPSGG